jgi:hypothetical protein
MTVPSEPSVASLTAVSTRPYGERMAPTARRFRSCLAPALLASAVAACVHKPTMTLDHAEISGVQLATLPPSVGLVMTVVLDVYNPNGYDVAVRAVRGQATFAGRYPLPVTFQAPPQGVWLPAGQTTQVRVPMTVPIQLAILLVQQSFASPSIAYRFTGAADVTATRTLQLESDNYAVDETGMVTRNDLLAVIPASFFPH